MSVFYLHNVSKDRLNLPVAPQPQIKTLLF